MANRYKVIEDEKGFATLYLYSDEVEPQNGVPVQLIDYSKIDWDELIKDVNNRLVHTVATQPNKYNENGVRELFFGILRSLLARQLNK